MYAPFNKPSIATTTVAGIIGTAQPGEDGLTLAPPQNLGFNEVSIPPRLYDKLLSIRLLSSVPLSYMVPDSSLLPPESIRFFFVDQTWVDRVIDGVLSAANTGSVDITFSCALNQLIRQTLDQALQALATANIQLDGLNDTLAWDPATQPITGMLIRSDVVRRWPNIGVQAWVSNGTNKKSAPVGVLRAEPLSQGIYIALFAGTPDLVQVIEPHVGLRFGVMVDDEKTPEDGKYHVDARNQTGVAVTPKTIEVPLRAVASRVIDVSSFAASLTPYATGTPIGSRLVAMELERQRWVQDFEDTTPEPDGLRNPPLEILQLGPLTGLVATVNPNILTVNPNIAQAVLEKK
jgi:hypothetical protein